MDFTLRPSLQHFSAVSIAVDLWKATEIRKDLESLALTYTSRHLLTDKIFCERKLGEVSTLKAIHAQFDRLILPEILKYEVKKILKPIGREIIKFYNQGSFQSKVSNFNDFIEHLNFTAWGMIDNRKTLDSFYEMGKIHYFDESSLGCTFCCSKYDDNLLTNHLPTSSVEEECQRFCPFVKVQGLARLLNLRRIGNVSFQHMKKKLAKRSVKYVKRYSVLSNDLNRIGVLEGRIASEKICCADFLFFLINQMNEEQQIVFFLENPYTVLREILSNWTKRQFFLQTFQLMNGFEDINLSYGSLLDVIAEMGNWEFADGGEIEELFKDVWMNCSQRVKLRTIECCRYLVPTFVFHEDSRSICRILDDANYSKGWMIGNIQRSISSHPMNIHRKDWDSLKLFLKEINSRVEKDVNFWFPSNARFELCTKLISNGKWELLDEFLQWVFESEIDINEFKKEFAEKQSVDICLTWFDENDIVAIDKFVEWCVKSEIERIKLKESLLQDLADNFVDVV